MPTATAVGGVANGSEGWRKAGARRGGGGGAGRPADAPLRGSSDQRGTKGGTSAPATGLRWSGWGGVRGGRHLLVMPTPPPFIYTLIVEGPGYECRHAPARPSANQQKHRPWQRPSTAAIWGEGEGGARHQRSASSGTAKSSLDLPSSDIGYPQTMSTGNARVGLWISRVGSCSWGWIVY